MHSLAVLKLYKPDWKIFSLTDFENDVAHAQIRVEQLGKSDLQKYNSGNYQRVFEYEKTTCQRWYPTEM